MNKNTQNYWFTVIIPVKDDIRILNLIASINKQPEHKKVEYILSFNGAKENFVRLIKEKINENIENYQILISDDSGTAKAINLGIRKSSSSRIIIIDSDCTLGDDYLEVMKESLERNEIVNGRVIFKGNNLFSKYTARLRTIVYGNQNNIFYSPNLGMHKEIINQLGQFNTKLKYGFDSEFSSRVIKAGYQVYFDPNAVVYHLCHENLWREIFIWIHYGKGRAYRYNSGCFGIKNLKNLINMLSTPKIFSSKEGFVFNLFTCSYYFFRNIGVLSALLFKKYD